MKTSISSSSLLSLVSVVVLVISCVNSANTDHYRNVVGCLKSRITDPHGEVIYTPTDTAYESVLESTISNLRFANHSKPTAIVTPVHESQVQAAIFCSKKHGLQVRTRSGGHDNEGLSYVSQTPFVIIDLQNLKAITIDVEKKTAWFEAGATLGQVYHAVSQKSRTLAFVAGDGPTVGTGGHISQGGVSMISRKFGVAADHVIDAKIVDVNGRILDRKSMGGDLFWAIRGGGGDSFGVITAYKVKLQTVPETVTAFTVIKTLEQNATQLAHRWQHVAHKIDRNLEMRLYITSAKSTLTGKKTIQITFGSLFIGGTDDLLRIMGKSLPELGLRREDCMEMSWIESVVFFAFFSRNVSIDALLSRKAPLTQGYFKGTSDLVTRPVPEKGLRGFWKLLLEEDVNTPQIQFTPFGGKMAEISESETAFAHRAGNIYLIGYAAVWGPQGNSEASRHINWVRRIRNYMTPYVSKSPRAAYISFRDLDVGQNNINGYTSYKQASAWGKSYFKNNFHGLVQVKTKVDPSNFFRNEQSFPSLAQHY